MGISKEKIRHVIWEYEYYGSGLKFRSGSDVEVLNIEIKKGENKVIADIILHHDIEAGHSERFNNCEYALDKLLEHSIFKEEGKSG